MDVIYSSTFICFQVSFIFKHKTVGFDINYVLVRIVLLHKDPVSSSFSKGFTYTFPMGCAYSVAVFILQFVYFSCLLFCYKFGWFITLLVSSCFLLACLLACLLAYVCQLGLLFCLFDVCCFSVYMFCIHVCSHVCLHYFLIFIH